MKTIYLDYAATTPVDPRVIKTMLPYFHTEFGNSASLHRIGRQANEILEQSRSRIASFIHARPEEIYFTSSATESNNTVLKGLASFHKQKKHILISSIEHDCIVETSHFLMKQGYIVEYIPVDREGFVDVGKIESLIRPDTLVVSVIHGNNEVGTVQDIKSIGRICKKNNVFFHTDAAQSFGKIPIDVDYLNIDLLTASSHKIYGPKGAALLFIRKGISIDPLLHGGGHENGRRSSTVNISSIVGFAKAVEIVQKEGEKENKKLQNLRDYMIQQILSRIPHTKLNGPVANRLSNNINISFFGVEGESLLLELDHEGMSVSTGSACSSRTLEPSHVLLALGLPPAEAHGSIRFSLGRWTTKKEIEKTIAVLITVVDRFRKLSPVYG